MKKFLFFLFLIFSVISWKQSNATHLIGGEITWECLGSGSNVGKLIFTVKIYRYCNYASTGIAAPVINNPLYALWGGPSTIPTTLYKTEDITPQCYQDSLGLDCYALGRRDGAIELRTFNSAPIHLVGVPDTNGSEFFVSACCRATPIYSSIGSLQNLGGSFYLKSIMYPFINPITQVLDTLGTVSTPSCYDSSPIFAASPELWIDSGRPTLLDMSSIDPDIDAVEYFWESPYSSDTSYIIWFANYNKLNQLPGKAHHTLNVPANLDQYTGNVTVTTHSPLGGIYGTCMDIKSFKCGQLVATIRREVPVSINSFSTVQPNNNVAPIVKFIHKTDTFINLFSKSVVLGDSIEFDIVASDIQINPNSVPQKVKLSVSGPFFAEGISATKNAKIGTPIYMDTSVISWKDFSWTYFFISKTHFKWKPECQQLVNQCGLGGLGTFKFVFTAADDYCAIPARTLGKVFITVIDTSAKNMFMDSLIETQTKVNLRWNKYSGSSFNKYFIYHTNSLALNPVPIDSISNVNTVNYSYSKSISDSTNYFLIKLDHNSGTCVERNVYSTFNLKLKNLNNGTVQLDWNKIALGNINLNQPLYRIFRKKSGGSYSLLDSTSSNRYIDSIPQCGTSYQYKMELIDTSLYASSQTQDSIHIGMLLNIPIVKKGKKLSFNYFAPHNTQWYRNGVVIAGANLDSISADSSGIYHAVLTFTNGCRMRTNSAQFLTWKSMDTRGNGSVLILWNPHHSGTNYIVTYSDSMFGPFIVLDTLSMSSTGYLDNSARADTIPRYYQIMLDSLNSNQGTSVQRTMFIGNKAYNLENTINWGVPFSSYQRIPNQYSLLRKTTSWAFKVVGTSSDTSIIDTIQKCKTIYTYRVSSADSLGFKNSSNYLDVSANDLIYTSLLNQKDSLYPQYLINDSSISRWYFNNVFQSDTTNYFLMDTMGNYSLKVKYGNKCKMISDTFRCFNSFPIPYPKNVSVDTIGGVSLNWNAILNTDTNFIEYLLYGSTDSLGPFILIDSINTINTNSYYHSSARADTIEWFYFIKVKAFVPCLDRVEISSYDRMVSTLGLNISNLLTGRIKLNWTQIFIKKNKSAGKDYNIYRRYQSPNWQLIGTSPYGMEEFTDTVIGCEDIIHYKVDMDSLGVLSEILGRIRITEFNVILKWVNDSVLVGLPGSSYKWYLNGVLISGQNTSNLVPIASGIYRLETILPNGCKAISNEVDLRTLAITEGSGSGDLKNFSVFPNPSEGKVTIQYIALKTGLFTIEVMDANGKLIHVERFESDKIGLNTHSLTLDHLQKGLYYLRANLDGARINQKLILN